MEEMFEKDVEVNPINPNMFGEGIIAYQYKGKLDSKALNNAVGAKLKAGDGMWQTEVNGVHCIGVLSPITIAELSEIV